MELVKPDDEEMARRHGLQTKSSSVERDAQVTAVLEAATEPLGPTEIGLRVNKPWSIFIGTPSQGRSAAVLPVLRRIGAARHSGGKYAKRE